MKQQRACEANVKPNVVKLSHTGDMLKRGFVEAPRVVLIGEECD